MTRKLVAFVAVNAALIVLIAVMPFKPAPDASEAGDIGRSLVTRWIPFTLAIATALAVALARGSHQATRILRRHFWLYLAVPASTGLLLFGHALGSRTVGVPYVAMVATIAIGGAHAVWQDRSGRSDRAIGLLLGAVTFASALALLPYERTVQLTRSDEPHYLIMMDSLIRDHDLDLGNNYGLDDYIDYYPDPLPDRHVIITGPRQLPIRDPGLPLIGALPFAIGRRTGVLVVMCLVGAAFAWRGYAFLRFHAFSRHAAIVGAGATALLHPVFTYTTQIYPDLPVALGVLIVAELLARPVTLGRLAAASAILGALPWLTVRAWFIVIGMGLVVAWLALAPLVRGVTRERLALVLAGGTPLVALVGAQVLLDLLMFGVPLPNAGYYLVQGQQTILAFTPQIGLPGLFLDRTFGLLSRAPLFAVAFFGLLPLVRRARILRSPGLVALFLGWLLYLLYIGNIQYWWADGSPSSRYQLATIALPMLALAAGVDRLRGTIGPALAWTAAGWTAVVTLYFALVPSVRYDLAADVAATGTPGDLWVHLSHVLRADPGLLFPSLVRAAPSDAVLTGAWVVVLAGLVVLGAARPAGPGPKARLR
ncbi:MAG TPA: hypothetical protein VM070_01430 [Candidatus Saccharimonadales bacterium]|nr:hypothetical protein [Candidatus Saccharimonadales bacterium]